jgi:hypothetical protein
MVVLRSEASGLDVVRKGTARLKFDLVAMLDVGMCANWLVMCVVGIHDQL